MTAVVLNDEQPTRRPGGEGGDDEGQPRPIARLSSIPTR